MNDHQPRPGDLVVGFDGHTQQSGRVVEHATGGGWLVDTLGCGRAILHDVAPAPADHPVHARATPPPAPAPEGGDLAEVLGEFLRDWWLPDENVHEAAADLASRMAWPVPSVATPPASRLSCGCDVEQGRHTCKQADELNAEIMGEAA